jgi:hypothetical protein
MRAQTASARHGLGHIGDGIVMGIGVMRYGYNPPTPEPELRAGCQ